MALKKKNRKPVRRKSKAVIKVSVKKRKTKGAWNPFGLGKKDKDTYWSVKDSWNTKAEAREARRGLVNEGHSTSELRIKRNRGYQAGDEEVSGGKYLVEKKEKRGARY
jgi:hypothetical protein